MVFDVINKVYHGDCIEVMQSMEDNSIDSIVSDPPYGISFMAKQWDKFTPKSFQEFSYQWGKEALRILKPGAYCLAFSGTRTYHRMVCGLEDAGFTIKDMIMWCYGCLSEDTEILTLNGWKGMNEVSTNDKVFSFNYENKNNNDIEISNILQVFKYDYNGEMIVLKNDNTDQLLTPNHKVLCKIKGRKQEKGIRNYYWKNEEWRYIDAGLITKGDHIYLPLGLKYNGKKKETILFWELVGLILTDGWFQGLAINISQVKDKIVKRIRYVLRKLKIDYSEYKKERSNDFNSNFIEYQFYLKSNELTKKIQDIIPNKKPTWELLHLSYNEKLGLYQGLMEGDGGIKGTDFYQSDIKTLEWFQVLCHLMGKQARINWNKKMVSIHNNPTTEIQGKHLTNNKIQYNGKVWCIETTIGNFFARRNGKIFITGNSGFPKSLDISKAIDNYYGVETNRKFIGIGDRHGGGNYDYMGRTTGKPTRSIIGKKITPSGQEYPSFELDDNNIATEFQRSKGIITEPYTNEAKYWDGWGTSLKPALEPVVVAQKPYENTYAENVLKYGVGGMNIDGCRINYTPDRETDNRIGTDKTWGGKREASKHTVSLPAIEGMQMYKNKGRFPSNLILNHHPECKLVGRKEINGNSHFPIKENWGKFHGQSQIMKEGKRIKKETIDAYDCHPDCPIHLMDEQTSEMLHSAGYSKKELRTRNYNASNYNLSGTILDNRYGDKGGASRFFYCAKAHKSERNAGLQDIKEESFGSIFDPNGTMKTGSGNEREQKAKNTIATLKPINVMRYLVRLVTPPNGTILDPFAGSGTTGIACIIEGFNYILIEKRKRFAEVIIPKRLEYWKDPKNWNTLKDHNILPKVKKLKNEKVHISFDQWLKKDDPNDRQRNVKDFLK